MPAAPRYGTDHRKPVWLPQTTRACRHKARPACGESPGTVDTLPLLQPCQEKLETSLAYARYDGCPVSPGHMLIMPFRHMSDYFDTTLAEKHAMLERVEAAKRLLDSEHAPDGYNPGINCGAAVGQSVPHVHYHLIPRCQGDLGNPRGGVRGVIPTRRSTRPCKHLHGR